MTDISTPSAPSSPSEAPLPPKKPKNTLALVALIVAAVGFVFACVPGALIVGWVLLPIAFILSLVALFMAGGKGLAVTALIVSIVGTIVGIVVFTTVVAGAVSDAFGGTDSTVDTSTSQSQAAQDPAETTDTGAAEGSRENPVAIGATINGNEWSVVVNSHNAAASDIVAAANPYNEAAPAGSHYEIVTYTVTYTGAESGLAAEVPVSIVTSDGNVVNSYDNMGVLDDSMGMQELYNGASVTGSAAFLVADGQSSLIRVRPGIIADEVFVQP